MIKGYKEGLPTFQQPDLYLRQELVEVLPKHAGLFHKLRYKGNTLMGRFEIRAASLFEYFNFEWESFDRKLVARWEENGRRRSYGPDFVVRRDSDDDWVYVEVKGIWDQRATDRRRIFEEQKGVLMAALTKERTDDLELCSNRDIAFTTLRSFCFFEPKIRRNVFEQKADRIARVKVESL